MGRAIVRDPKVFLFDEPLSNLDAKLRVAMRAEIKALHQRLKTTTVYVTHDQVEAMTMADKIVVMQDGRIEQIGSPLELYDRPNNLFVAQFIGSPAMNVVTGTLRRQGGRRGSRATACALAGRGGWPGCRRPGGHLRRAARAPVGRRTGRLGPGRGDRRRADRGRDRAAGPGRRIADRAGAARSLGVQPGDKVGLAVETGAVHLFDPASGRSLTMPEPARRAA
jgi:multiple sugar transport system ATP-binding protein